MKHKLLVAMLACALMAGCSAPKEEAKTEPVNTTKTETEAKDVLPVTDTLFIGYGKEDLFYGDMTETSYVVNNKGEKILELNSNYKSIVEIDGKQYALERTLENTKENEYGGYDYKYLYTIYNDKGEKQGEIKNVEYIQHIKGGTFYIYNYAENMYETVNIFTGEREKTNLQDIVFVNNEVVATLHMDEEYKFKGISIAETGEYKELPLYDSAYPISTDNNTFIVARLNFEEAKKINPDAGEYTNRTVHLLDAKGEKIVDVDFQSISSQDNQILAYAVSGETYILDGENGEIMTIVPGEVVKYYERTGVFVKFDKEDSAKNGGRFSLVDMDMNVISGGWDGFSDMYRSGTDEFFTFSKYHEDGSYNSDVYIINLEGEVTFPPFAEIDEWIMANCKNYIIIQGYNRETYEQTYKVYDYYGNLVDLGKNYVYLNRQYNPGGYGDYFIAAYENPVSAGYLYDIYDEELNLLHSDFNYVYPFGNTGRFVSVAQGFDIGIFDVETGNWVYREASFSDLDD